MCVKLSAPEGRSVAITWHFLPAPPKTCGKKGSEVDRGVSCVLGRGRELELVD